MLETIYKKTNTKEIVLIVISALAIVAFWRGAWNLMDYYLFPGNFVLSQAVSIVFGLIILIVLSRSMN